MLRSAKDGMVDGTFKVDLTLRGSANRLALAIDE
jgi:hypothetical protein